MEKVNSKYYCIICDKYYKSGNSFSNHKRKFHLKTEPKNNQNTLFGEPNNSIKMLEKSVFKCKYCKKTYKHSQNLKIGFKKN